MSDYRYVQTVRSGRGLKRYYRRGDFRRVLNSPFGSAAFRVEWEACNAEFEAVCKAQVPQAGTVGGALKEYVASQRFRQLAPSTRKEYHRHFEPLTVVVGPVLLGDLTPKFVRDLLDVWAARGHRFAAIRLQFLKNSVKDAMIDGRVSPAAFLGIEKPRAPHGRGESNPAWTDDEVDAFIVLALKRKMPGLARAIAIARWAGFRRGTVCKIQLSARCTEVDAEGSPRPWIRWRTEKRGKDSDKPEDGRLTELIGRTPNQALTIAYNQRGEPWKERQLNQATKRLLETLEQQGKVRPGLTLHGLRHARGVELAEAGASDAEIMAQLEHTSARAAQTYRRQASQRKLAISSQSKIDDRVVSFREAAAKRKNQG